MAYDDTNAYVFAHRAVQDKAPDTSGVYAIYSAQRWLYVGESADMKQSLFRHLNEPGPCMTGRGPLSFSFEIIAPAERVARQRTLVASLLPMCQGND